MGARYRHRGLGGDRADATGHFGAGGPELPFHGHRRRHIEHGRGAVRVRAVRGGASRVTGFAARGFATGRRGASPGPGSGSAGLTSSGEFSCHPETPPAVAGDRRSPGGAKSQRTWNAGIHLDGDGFELRAGASPALVLGQSRLRRASCVAQTALGGRSRREFFDPYSKRRSRDDAQDLEKTLQAFSVILKRLTRSRAARPETRAQTRSLSFSATSWLYSSAM